MYLVHLISIDLELSCLFNSHTALLQKGLYYKGLPNKYKSGRGFVNLGG